MFKFKEERRKEVWELPELTLKEQEEMIPYVMARYAELERMGFWGKLFFRFKRWYKYK